MTHLITKIFYFFTLFLLLTIISSAQTIGRIEITGNKNFESSDYLTWMKIGIGAQTMPGLADSIIARTKLGLANYGYMHSRIETPEIVLSPDSQNVNITVNVNEGEPTFINKVIPVNADSRDSLIIASAFEWLIDQPLNSYEIQNSISEVLDNYENIGYPFAVLKIESIYFHTDTADNKYLADIYLSTDKKEKSKIDVVELLGNTSTKDYVILRQLGLNIGDEYSQGKIDAIPKRLNRLKFFDHVQAPSFYFNSKDEGVLSITVKEKSTNNFDGIVGFVPGTTDNESGYFTGYVNISMRNLFGTGRAAAIRWQQETRYSQELELKYLEPWVFNYPFNISVDLFQRKQDTTYVQRKFEGNIVYIATEDISASIILSTESTIPTVSTTQQFTVYNSTTLSTGLNLTIDTRDDFYSPTEGIYFLNTYKYSSKEITGPAEYITPTTETNYNLQRLELDFSFFYEFLRGQVAALSIHAREMRGSLFEVSDLYLLGGANTLRGYREKQFIGNRLFWSNAEYRYLLTKRSFAFLFCDTGYYLRNANAEQNLEELSGFKVGYGLGINLETGLGVLSVSYALGEGDSFNQGKIHFGILNEF